MYVCLCHGVTEAEVRAVIGEGAMTVDDVGEECLAGTGCGGCQERIGWMLRKALNLAAPDGTLSTTQSSSQHAEPHMSAPSKGSSS